MVHFQNSQERQRKRRKLQQSIRTMFKRTGPKFVEAVGVQLVCRYCNRKFKAPQGLSAHIHMHERAGDFLCQLEEKREQPLNSLERFSHIEFEELDSSIQPSVRLAKSPPDRILWLAEPASLPEQVVMTRRFTIAEKLRIIDN